MQTGEIITTPSRPSSPERSRQIETSVVTVLTALLASAFVLGTLVVLLWSFGLAQRQYRINQTYVPAPAKIISSKHTYHREPKGGGYFTADVTFEYEVNGKKYQSSNLAPTDARGDEDWSYSIIGRYPPGQTCQAYYDPKKPDEAVLMLGYSFEPYGGMLLMGACFSMALMLGVGAWLDRERAAVPADSGWFKIFPGFNLPKRLFIAKLCTVTWYATGLLAVAHYFHYVPPPHGRWLTFIVFAVLGLVPLVVMVRYRLITRNLSEARLLLSVPVVTLGQEFNFRISQAPLRSLTLSAVQVQFGCIGTKKVGKSRRKTLLFREAPITLENHTVQPGQPLDFSGTLKPPADMPVTGRDPTGKQTWIDWQITLLCKIKGGPDFESRFPVIVYSAPIEAAVPRPADLPSRAQGVGQA